MSWERRKHQRLATVVPVQIAGELFHAHGHTADLSAGGCVIAAAHTPEPGQHLHLLLHLPTSPAPLNIHLAVVRWRALGVFGVEFIRLSPAHQQDLQHYLYLLELAPALGQPVGAAEAPSPRPHARDGHREGAGFTPLRAGRARQHDWEFSRVDDAPGACR